MAGKHAEPPPPPPPPRSIGSGTDSEQDSSGERAGPLAIRRVAKEDGRALIVFTRLEGAGA